MKREDDEQLWDLLGRAAHPPQLSDFFARNVVRQVRQEPRRFERLQSWFSLRRLIPASVVAVAVIGTALVLHPLSRPAPVAEGAPEIVAKIDPQDYDVVADLDVLIASDENNLWDENQSL
jgi:hypothetical protein